MKMYCNTSIKPFHTFSIEQTASVIVEVECIADIKAVYSDASWSHLPKIILGKGSNVLFTEAYQGVVIINRLKGIDFSEDSDSIYLDVMGGEDWPSLVEDTVQSGISGLENLALIPGCAGSAPVQNIGAYGVELKDVCSYVEYLDLLTFSLVRLSAEQCQFQYRDSIFKNVLRDNAFVTRLGIRLPKQGPLTLDYGPLKQLPGDCTYLDVFNTICQNRRRVFPNTKKTGNAGSFFKNPIISTRHFNTLKAKFPAMVCYLTPEGAKVSAGWLIDQCGLKGICVSGACVHERQALVLVNWKNATSQDVVSLANYIRVAVFRRYGIVLEYEVRLVGKDKKT